MQTQEVGIQPNVRVTLKSDAELLDEVMVVAYGTAKKSAFTGSASTVKSEKIAERTVSNVTNAMAGQVAGVQITQSSGQPGSDANIRIRGIGSMSASNNPLYVVDGVPYDGAISAINPADIESMTVLKDAAATAIYGSKAANGVVVVETKLPRAGALRLNYNANVQLSFADLTDYNLMNSYEKLTFERLAGCYRLIDEDGNIKDEDQDQIYQDLMKEVARGVDTYWLSEPLRFAVTHRHTLSIEGGDNVFRYGVGLSYGMTEGVMKGSDRQVMNGNVRLIYRKGRLAFTNNLNIDFTKAEREPVAFSEFAQANPYFRKYDENNELKKILYSTYSDIYYNPLWDMNQNNFDVTETTGFTNNFEVDWRVIDELRVRGRFGLTKSNEQSKVFRSPFDSEFDQVSDNADKGRYTEANTQILNYDGELSITYGKLLREKHMVNAVGGMRFTQNSSNQSEYEVQGFIDDEFSNPAFALGYQEDEVHGTINGERAIYIIKRKGRPDCYRIRILLKESNTPGKSYYEFAYFPGDATMKFDGLTTEAAFVESMNNGLFDWNSPSAIMQIPACGFIHTIGGNKLDGDGVSTVLRSSDWVKAGYNWVCYLRSDQSFGLFDGSRKALGDQIRCVRDVTAK